MNEFNKINLSEQTKCENVSEKQKNMTVNSVNPRKITSLWIIYVIG